LGAACLLLPNVQAQGPFARMNVSVIGTMVDIERVQKELKLSEDQTKKCKAIYDKIQAKYQDQFDKLRAQKQPQQILDLTKIVNQETLKAFAEVLQPPQIKRLQQIDLQQRGAQAFLEPDIVKALKLTHDQQDLIKTINADAAKEMKDSISNPQGKVEEMSKKLTLLRKETMERVTAVLNKDQLRMWQNMEGTPFEFKVIPPKK
jgi:hypothetical protein